MKNKNKLAHFLENNIIAPSGLPYVSKERYLKEFIKFEDEIENPTSPNSKFTESKNSPKVCPKCKGIRFFGKYTDNPYCIDCGTFIKGKPS